MKHLGDIRDIHGWDIEPVDLMVGGSPCQDLSVSGDRKSIKHSDLGDEETTRSGLFMEQIRIIREMREYEKDVRKRPNEFVRPRFCIWENVPGTLSAVGTDADGNEVKGEAFRIVLEQFAKIADPTVSIPRPPKGKWQPHGVIVGDGWSLAWTQFNSAEWNVPQRRQRICVAVDFGSTDCGELLFGRVSPFTDSLQGSFEERGEEKEQSPQRIGGGLDSAESRVMALHEAEGQDLTLSEQAYSLTRGGGKLGQGVPAVLVESRERERVAVTYDARGNGDGRTTNAITGDHNNRITDYTSLIIE